jgi:hypothetical protein
MFWFTHLLTAASSVLDKDDNPRLIEIKDGLPVSKALFLAQSRPLITPPTVPPPALFMTLTAIKFTFLATPYVVPPRRPATCVP